MTYKSNRILMQKTFHALVTFDWYFYNVHAILIKNIIIVPLLLRKDDCICFLMLFIVKTKQNQKLKKMSCIEVNDEQLKKILYQEVRQRLEKQLTTL